MIRAKSFWMGVAFLFALALWLPQPAAAVCCTAVEDVCSECCPGSSCGCIYGHSTGRCICSGCDGFELESLREFDISKTSQRSCLGAAVDIKELQRRARQLRAVPVFMAETRSVELIPVQEISSRSFSQALASEDPLVSMKLNNLDVNETIRLIAASAGVDMVVPSGLEGTLNGHFPDLPWKEALELVLESSGSDLEVRIAANGLVRLAPR
jgi:hypothetical protein